MLDVGDEDVEAIGGSRHKKLWNLRVVADFVGVSLTLVDEEKLRREVAGTASEVTRNVVRNRKIPYRDGIKHASGAYGEGGLIGGVPLERRHR